MPIYLNQLVLIVYFFIGLVMMSFAMFKLSEMAFSKTIVLLIETFYLFHNVNSNMKVLVDGR